MQYLAPLNLDDAVTAIRAATGQVKVMAGGTDLLARAACGAPFPDLLLDLKKIPELNTVCPTIDGGFCIGAAVNGVSIQAHQHLRENWPGVWEAVGLIGSVQIQGRASLGGNLCNASPAADSVPAMIAAGAVCRIIGLQGERTVAVRDVIIAPGRTCLRADEFLVSIQLPKAPPRSADAYLRMTPRTEMDIAIAGVAAQVVLNEQGLIESCQIALGAVSPVPILAEAAARTLIGSSAGDEVMVRFRRNISAQCRPISDKRGTAEYRSHVAGVLAARAVRIALQRAQSRGRES
jgi:carbon-monoxide dehydrogenase medium subunit